jgi:hypothetical protein
MPLLVLLLLLPLIVIALTPFMLVQRYRVGTARRQGRPWLATFGVVMMAGSTIFFLVGAGVTSLWVQDAFTGALAGVAIGMALGLVGLLVTRWELAPGSFHYTPNKWLVLSVTLIVTARLLYGFYRSWVAAQAGISGTALVTTFGVPQSLAAGGTVLGYYLAYGAGLRWRLKKWQHRRLRRVN